MLLEDRVAIVTGSARGLGKAFSLRFVEEGAKVVVCDVLDCTEIAKQIESVGGEVLSLEIDVTSEESTLEMAKRTVEHFGRIDILVNNAAIYGGLRFKPFFEFSVDEWDRMMAVNLRGVWLCCKAVFPYMKEQGKGKIISLSSAAYFKGTPFLIHYITSKGGVVGFTKALARELGQYHINVNAIAPGLTMTRASHDLSPPERTEKYIETLSIKRPQQPEDLLGAMVFLASDNSDFITGQTIVVDGGGLMP